MKQNISIEDIKDAVNSAYDAVKNESEGKNADYIPYLENVPKDLFGISVCMPSGEIVKVGDTDYLFGIESISKVPTAIMAMQQCGADKVLEMIGADATGLPFNSIMAILLENDHPSTPLVNAGAISACSMIKPLGDSKGKWYEILYFLERLCGCTLEIIEELYKSESDTNYTNRAISWLLKSYDRIYDDPMMSLDIYTRQCSIGISTEALSVLAGTIVNNGINPITKEKIFEKDLTPKITSMMSTVGFYERTGDWMFQTGIPAKTGVGGGILGVMPGLFGIAAFAPPIDESGNSVKAQKAIKHIVENLQVNVFG